MYLIQGLIPDCVVYLRWVIVMQDEVVHYQNENGDNEFNNLDGGHKVSFSCIYIYYMFGRKPL